MRVLSVKQARARCRGLRALTGGMRSSAPRLVRSFVAGVDVVHVRALDPELVRFIEQPVDPELAEYFERLVLVAEVGL
jgi:hypothetical protein